MNTLFLQQKLDSIEALINDETLTDTQVLDDIRGILKLPAPPSDPYPILARVRIGSEEQVHLLSYSAGTNQYRWNSYEGSPTAIDPDMVVVAWDYAESLI
jgi:hypothetical protein